MRRVEQAKEARSIYWHVPAKEGTISPSARDTVNAHTRRQNRARAVPDHARGTATRLDGGAGPTASEISSSPIGLAPPQVQSPIIVETPGEATRTQTPPALSTEGVWRTLATQQEAVQQ